MARHLLSTLGGGQAKRLSTFDGDPLDVQGGPDDNAMNGGANPVFVYRPGDPAGNRGNIYTTEATLQAAWNLVAGPKLLQCDDTFGACNFALPNWNLDQAIVTGTKGNEFTLMSFQPGFSGTFQMMTGLNIFMRSLLTSGTAFALTSRSQLILICSLFEQVVAGGVMLSNTQQMIVALVQGILGNSQAGMNTISPASGLVVRATANSFVQAHAIGGAGTATIQYDASTTLGAQDATLALQPQDLASQVVYSAGTVGNWPGGVSPATVAPALDDLAGCLLFASGSAQNGTGVAPTENASVAVVNGTATALPNSGVGPVQPNNWIQVQLKGDPNVYWLPLWKTGT